MICINLVRVREKDFAEQVEISLHRISHLTFKITCTVMLFIELKMVFEETSSFSTYHYRLFFEC